MTISELFAILKEKAEAASPPPDVEALVRVELTGNDPAQWNGQIAGGRVVLTDSPLGEPDITITAASETAIGIFQKTVSPMMALMTGKIKVSGDMGKAALIKNLLTSKKK